VNKEELFNLRRTSALNVIKHIFGVLKRRFRILLLAPKYSMEIQARIPTALCAIHNFICTHDADESLTEPEFMDYTPNDHDHNASVAAAAEADRSSGRRDIIAQQMWDDYVRIYNEILCTPQDYYHDLNHIITCWDKHFLSNLTNEG
jgi:hypothetical protein